MMVSPPPNNPGSFRQQTWQTKWLCIGAAFLALWYSVRYWDREWLSQWPVLLLLVVTGFAPQLFLLLFPLFTRDKENTGRILIPGVKRWLIEFAIALPIVIATMVALGGVNYLVGVLSPGKSLTPDAVKGMASSSPRFIYPLLLFSFTFAPVAEEVFFRGFVYNALRKRMPTVVAGVLQSLIFGFCHFFGTTHAAIAVALGLVFTTVYEWRKTLVSPILVHVGINVIFAVGVLAMMAEYADRPTIGVIGGQDPTECVVRAVIPDSAASESEILVGDRIVAFDGQPIASFPELAAAVATRQPQDRVTLTIVRGDETLDIGVTLKRRANTTLPP
jgi:membrane protease YdiL (CAAX protease family)